MENIYLQLIGYTLYGVISFGACLSGSEADKVFHNQLMSSKERLALEFAKVKDAHSSEAHLGCKLCNSPMLGENIKTITINKIPDECIAGALKRSVQQQSVVCKGEFPVKKTNLSAKDYPCVTDDVASYLSRDFS